MTPDQINAVFELIAAMLLSLNVRRLWIDQELRGISLWPILFFAAWGGWNLIYYPHLQQWWSYAAGVAVLVANLAWLGLYGFLRLERYVDNMLEDLWHV